MAKDCWSGGGGKEKGKGKGKGKKGKRKGKDAGSLDDQSGERAEPEHEAGGLDLGAFSKESFEEREKEWVNVTLDTGAARPVFPEDFKHGQRIEQERPMKFKTATGEIVHSSGDIKLDAWDEWGGKVRFPGTLAPVHKPLLAAGQLTDKGNDVWVSGDSAFILGKGSKIQKLMRETFRKAMAEHEGAQTIGAYKENGVYNVYVQPAKAKGGDEDCYSSGAGCAAVLETSPFSGGPRRSHSL